MKDSRFEIQVGIALVAALLVLVFGLMWFQEYRPGANYQQVVVAFPSVGGLGAGDPVRVRGVDMGKVTSVDLSEQGVEVSIRLDGRVGLTDQAEFLLGSAGIMGERMISVEPGQGAPVSGSPKRFDGQYQPAITEMLGDLKEVNLKVSRVLSRADSVLGQLQDDQSLSRTLASTRRAADVAAEVLRENRDSMGKATDSLASVAQRFESFLEKHEEDLGKGVEGLARNAAALDTLLADLSEVVGGTQHVLTALREEQGTAGKLIYDEEMAQSVVESIDRLRFLLEDLQLNPQRYLTVRIF